MNNIDNVKKAMMRAMMVAFKMGADGKVSEYSAAWELSKIVDDLGNEICANVGAAKSDASPADIMDKITQDPDRFLRGLTIKDRYPGSFIDKESYTIIKVEPKDTWEDWIHGISFQDGKWIYVKGHRSKNGTYVSGKEYREVEIPTWVLNG